MDTNDKTRGRGRPPTGTTPKRYFRLDDDSWKLIGVAADINEESVSEYIRRVILKDANRTIRTKTK